MHRFYLPTAQCEDATLFLAGREAHHARHVLRLRRGERVLVLDGAGHEFLCDVQDYDRDKVRLTVGEKRSHPPPPCRVTLVQAVPKGRLIESIIQKATELGASRIVPLLSERVITQLDDEDVARKTARLQSVAIEAIKQCGSPWLPRVEPPLTPNQFLARNEAFELPLIASLQSGSRSPREYFRAFQAQHGRSPVSASIWIGPEGDFTPAETEAIESHGALPITLGRLVLRTETATVYCLSILNYELQSPSS
ncbi:MAG: RsmE family RNA methyltransferase [Verrucomicrobiota bacterium]